MSTSDVPGHKPENHDELAMGCWAEHDDGSLILVESTEGNRIVYSIFDLRADPALEYRDAMLESAFKRTFSWPTDSGDRWTWHDKTPFPWDRVMDSLPGGAKYVEAGDQLSAAARVADALRLRSRELKAERYEHLRERTWAGAQRVRDKLQRAIGELRR